VSHIGVFTGVFDPQAFELPRAFQFLQQFNGMVRFSSRGELGEAVLATLDPEVIFAVDRDAARGQGDGFAGRARQGFGGGFAGFGDLTLERTSKRGSTA